MRPIDADALKEKIDSMWNGRPLSFLGARILVTIDEAPTIDADRPQGEWKFVGSSIEMMWACPFCGERTFGFEEHLPNYCSNCGADMRKGADDE